MCSSRKVPFLKPVFSDEVNCAFIDIIMTDEQKIGGGVREMGTQFRKIRQKLQKLLEGTDTTMPKSKCY